MDKIKNTILHDLLHQRPLTIVIKEDENTHDLQLMICVQNTEDEFSTKSTPITRHELKELSKAINKFLEK